MSTEIMSYRNSDLPANIDHRRKELPTNPQIRIIGYILSIVQDGGPINVSPRRRSS